MTFMFLALGASRGITLLEDLLPAALDGAYRRVVAFVKGRGHAAKLAADPPRELRWSAVALAALAAFKIASPSFEEMSVANANTSKNLFVEQPPRELDQPFRQARGNRRDAHIFPPIGLGSLYCVEGIPVPESARLRGDLAQEEYPADPAVATVKRVMWSPNAIDLDVDAKAATTVFVNQNWSRGWRSNIGTVRSEQGMLAIDVPAGQSRLEIRYRDYKVYFALLVSLATLGAILFFGGRQLVRATRRELAAFDGLPLFPGDPAPVVAAPAPEAVKAPAEDAPSETPDEPPASEPK
jgi:hypothetical protein